MKTIKVAINGFGRIGRNVLRAYLQYLNDYPNVEIVAINDVADPQVLLHLLKFDSTHGRLSAIGVNADVVQGGQTSLVIAKSDGTPICQIRLLQEPSPAKLPWDKLDIDVVLECTGQFRENDQASLHRHAGAKQVIVGAAPFDEVDACVVMGVNHQTLNAHQAIISSVSCTTQALVPLLWLMDKHFGVQSALLTEVHAVTADQTVLDSAHRDLRRARASGYNIIPTTSSSITATTRVLPQMAGKINGYSIRVPTITVAMIDVSLILSSPTDLHTIAHTLKQASNNQLQGIMDYTDEPLVSSDFIHDRHSLIIDGGQLLAVGNQLKILAWYDNEWGYANRLLDICQYLASVY